MPVPHALSRGLSVLVAASAMLAATVPAHAGVIAVFDPVFGSSIPNLGFRGSITLDVTDGCYALGSGFHATGGSCRITVESAQINYYNSGSTSDATIYTKNLTGSFFAATYVFGAYFDPLTGQLAGLDTADSDRFGVAISGSNPTVGYTGDMLLYFASGTRQLEEARASSGLVTPSSTVPGVGGAYLIDCNALNRQDRVCRSGDPASTSAPGRLTFTTVPEPATIALALLGFGSLALSRRRARIVR